MDVSHCWLRGPPLLSIRVKQSTGPGHPPPKAPRFLNQPSSSVIYWLLETAFRDTYRNRQVQKKRNSLFYTLSFQHLYLTLPVQRVITFLTKKNYFFCQFVILTGENKEPQRSQKRKGPDLEKGIHWVRKWALFLSHIISNINILWGGGIQRTLQQTN